MEGVQVRVSGNDDARRSKEAEAAARVFVGARLER